VIVATAAMTLSSTSSLSAERDHTSFSWSNPSRPIQGFADSDGWLDDTSDGPVRASVKLLTDPPDKIHDAKTAWVIVTPPDFAPEIRNLISLYDVAYQVAVDHRNKWRPSPNDPAFGKVSFVRHVQPILERAVTYQWVNKFNRRGHSGTRPGNFEARWDELAGPSSAPDNAPAILARLRDPNQPPPTGTTPRSAMPRLHDETNSSAVLPLTRTQWAVLEH
jgi:hypothetical protein